MKRILFLALLTLSLTTLYAVDFGLDIKSTNAYSTGINDDLALKDRADAWISLTTETTFLRLAGFYEFSAEYTPTSSMMTPYRFDFGNSYATFLMPEVFGKHSITTVSFGRLDLQDAASRIISGLIDSATLNYKVNTLEFGALAGYTGFLSKDDANIVITPSDFNESKDSSITFAPKKIILGGKFKILEVLERHDLGLEFHGQFDLRDSGTTNTQYAELSAEGRPLRWFKWKAYTIAQIWDETAPQYSLAAGSRFQFSFPDFFGMIIVQSVDWASGSIDKIRQFAPLNQTPVAEIFSAPFADILSAKINMVIQPMRGMITGGSFYTLLRSSTNAPADPYFLVDSTSPLLGLEADVMNEWTLSSELTVNFKGGVFFPNTWDGGYTAATANRWKGSVEVKLSL